MTINELLKLIFFNPKKGMRKVVAKGKVEDAAKIVLLLIITFWIPDFLLGHVTEFITDAIIICLMWVAGFGLISLVATGLGGRGNFEKTLIAIGYSLIPMTLAYLISYLLLAFVIINRINVTTAAFMIGMLGLIATGLIWTFLLSVIGVREVHKIDTFKAFISTAIIPLILLFLLPAKFFLF